MCSGLIDWCAFDWQSFATLVSGLAAVSAAFWVGLRQADIQKRQTKIQETALRSDLFDRRFKVFERAEQFLREIIQHADDPSQETQREFQMAMGESRFLFKQDVRLGLKEIWDKWAGFHALKMNMKHSFLTTGHYGDGNTERDAIALTWFFDRFTNLSELFDELMLGGEISQD